MNTNRSAVLCTLLAVGASAQTPLLAGGEIFSTDTVRFGSWEMRARLPAAPGTIASFFTYFNDSWMGGDNPWREIDIEMLGDQPGGFQSNVITGHLNQRIMREGWHDAGRNLSEGFHTYAVDWTPDSIVWRLDGQVVRRDVGTRQVQDLRDRAKSWRMNIWASDQAAWVGTLDTTNFPLVHVVNWLAFSRYTPGAGPGGSDFTPEWIEEFDQLDPNVWGRGDWTFETNLATFQTNHVRVSGGHLNLLLSTWGTRGRFPASIPSDPLGNRRETSSSVKAQIRAVPKSIVQTDRSLILPSGGPAAIYDLRGRLLHQVESTHPGRVEGLPQGVVLVRTTGSIESIVIP